MAERPATGVLRVTRTIRFRITALAAVAVLVVLVGTAVALVLAQERMLTDNLDETISVTNDGLGTLAENGDLPAVVSGVGDDDGFVQVVDENGSVVSTTTNLAGEPVLGVAMLEPGETSRWQTATDLPHDDAAFRVLARRVDDDSGSYTIAVGATLDDVREATRSLATSLLVAVPAVSVLIGALVWWLVGRTLRPVEAIRSEVEGMDGSDLRRRVPEPGSGDEIDRLAHTMNGMLERVEVATERQRGFVADASHELRSPLTRIRSELEVDHAHPESADVEATRASVLAETVALQNLVADLLYLARGEADATRLAGRAVDLDDLVVAESERLRALGEVAVDGTGVSAARVRGDERALNRVIANLAENAARHATSSVAFQLGVIDDEAVLVIADDGPGIAEEDRERVFERFTRLDESRTSSTGGAGLGLAIVREIVERHGGTVGVEGPRDEGARLVVRIPAGDD